MEPGSRQTGLGAGWLRALSWWWGDPPPGRPGTWRREGGTHFYRFRQWNLVNFWGGLGFLALRWQMLKPLPKFNFLWKLPSRSLFCDCSERALESPLLPSVNNQAQTQGPASQGWFLFGVILDQGEKTVSKKCERLFIGPKDGQVSSVENMHCLEHTSQSYLIRWVCVLIALSYSTTLSR